MKTVVLILTFAAVGLTPLLLSGTARADVEPRYVPDRCSDLRLEIEDAVADGLDPLPEALIKLGLSCALGRGQTVVPVFPIQPDAVPVTHVALVFPEQRGESPE